MLSMLMRNHTGILTFIENNLLTHSQNKSLYDKLSNPSMTRICADTYDIKITVLVCLSLSLSLWVRVVLVYVDNNFCSSSKICSGVVRVMRYD